MISRVFTVGLGASVVAACAVAGCEPQSSAEPGGASSSSNGGATPNIVAACVADELDGTTQATSVFDVGEGLSKSVAVSFAGGQLQTLDGMTCTWHALDVAPEYPGCEQGWDCGPCYCQLTVPGFGRNMWSLKCSDPAHTWEQCAQYKYVQYEVAPYVTPSASGSSSGGSSGSQSCGACKSCYENCNDSCAGYPGSCSTNCMKNCDKCCKAGG